MSPLHASDLPAAARARLEAAAGKAAGPGASPAGPSRTEAVPYECVACGERMLWTSAGGYTPVAIVEHQDRTGHGRYRQVLG